MKKRKIIIASHGTLAEGLANALKIVAGDCGIETICCYTTPDFDLDQAIQEALTRADDGSCEVCVFTDINGGSVNNGFLKVMNQYDFHLFTNVNMAFLVNFILSDPSVEEAEEEAKDAAFQVRYCNRLCSDISDTEDDL